MLSGSFVILHLTVWTNLVLVVCTPGVKKNVLGHDWIMFGGSPCSTGLSWHLASVLSIYEAPLSEDFTSLLSLGRIYNFVRQLCRAGGLTLQMWKWGLRKVDFLSTSHVK